MFDNLIAFAQESQNTGTSSFETLCWIASVVGMWKMFEKAGEPGWPSLIPLYRSYKLCELTMGNPWYWLRLFVFCIPVVGWIAGFYFMYQMYRAVALAYGKPETYAWGLMFLTPIFYCLLGFGDASFYGPMGAGDTRTTQARQSRTVNFDVVKNEPEQKTYQNQPEVEEIKPEPAAKEDTVEFNFDEPVE